MATPTGVLVRFPILDALGDSKDHAPSQRVVKEGLAGKMGINDAYTKAESQKLTQDLLLPSTGQATNKTMTQKAITDELNLRYTKTESDNRYYTKTETNNLIKDVENKAGARHMNAAGNIDTPVAGIFIGPWADAGGTKPDLGGEGMLTTYFTPDYSSGGQTLCKVFQRAEGNPASGNNLSGEILWRQFIYNRGAKTISSNTGWSRPRYRWSRG